MHAPLPQLFVAPVAVHSRHDHAGETVTASVAADVRDTAGRVVLPAGSTVEMTITELRPATSRSQADGRLALRVNTFKGAVIGGAVGAAGGAAVAVQTASRDVVVPAGLR